MFLVVAATLWGIWIDMNYITPTAVISYIFLFIHYVHPLSLLSSILFPINWCILIGITHFRRVGMWGKKDSTLTNTIRINWLVEKTSGWRYKYKPWPNLTKKFNLIGRDPTFYFSTSFFTQVTDVGLLKSEWLNNLSFMCDVHEIILGQRSLNIGGKRALVQYLSGGWNYMDNPNRDHTRANSDAIQQLVASKHQIQTPLRLQPGSLISFVRTN